MLEPILKNVIEEENTMPSKTLFAKSLTILEDQMQHEFLACKKAEHYAQTFADPTLRDLANNLAYGHRERFERLLSYLNSHV